MIVIKNYTVGESIRAKDIQAFKDFMRLSDLWDYDHDIKILAWHTKVRA